MRPAPSQRVAVSRCMLGVTVMSTACLADPPTFEPRGQIPPFIMAGQVEPPLGAVYEDGSPIPINVPFRSEDVGVPLEARFYLDLPPGASSGDAEDGVIVPAGNFEDLTRFVGLDWNRVDPGCHSLTLILTYQGNYDTVGQSRGLPLDNTRAARVVWWLNMGDAEGEVRMSTCPGASQDESPVPSVR